MKVPFRRDLEFEYGVCATVSPLVRRVIARNPSAFTFHGTGTYIVGGGAEGGPVAIIDPGPADDAHVEAVLAAVAGETVSHILITHTHIDHSPATPAIKAATGAPSYGFGPHGGGRNAEGVEAGADHDFVPDHVLGDGDAVSNGNWTLEAVHTPGHTSNHLCFAFAEEKTLFSGDHVMGWSTTVISPPDGSMADYFASLTKLIDRDETRYWPTHGAAIDSPRRFVRALVGHRRLRENQILAHVETGVGSIPEIVSRMYADIDPRLHRAAGRSVLAHLVHLVETGRAVTDGPPEFESHYSVA